MSDYLVPREDQSIQEIEQTKDQNIAAAINDVFQLSVDQAKEAKSVANLYKLKHGLMAAIPIICKVKDCPYYDICTIDQSQRILGSRCLHEIGVMVSRFESLCTELDIKDQDTVDAGLAKDVIDIEMMMLRVDKKFALTGDVLADVFEAVDQFGKVHLSKGVDPLLTFKLQLYDKKMKLLEKLNSTRKDKAEEIKKKKDPSVKSATLIAKAKILSEAMKKMKTEPIDVEELDVIYQEDMQDINEVTPEEVSDIIEDEAI